MTRSRPSRHRLHRCSGFLHIHRELLPPCWYNGGRGHSGLVRVNTPTHGSFSPLASVADGVVQRGTVCALPNDKQSLQHSRAYLPDRPRMPSPTSFLRNMPPVQELPTDPRFAWRPPLVPRRGR